MLLRNRRGVLPVQAGVRTMAVVGDAYTVHGSGSGAVLPPRVVTPADGITPRAKAAGVSVVSQSIP